MNGRKYEKKNIQEQLFNRILINIVIAIAAYIFLYILYAKFYMGPAIMFGIIFLIAAIIGYILSSKKKMGFNVKNYAHMFLAFSISMFFTRSSVIVGRIVGINKFTEMVNSSKLFRIFVNSRYEVIALTWLGAIYLTGMLVYNCIKLRQADKKNR